MHIKQKFTFQVSSWFETIFALQVLTDPDSRIHGDWKKQTLEKLPASFHKQVASLGGSPFLWPMLADSLLQAPFTDSFGKRLSLLKVLPEEQFQRTVFLGIFHEPAAVSRLMSGRSSLSHTIAQVSKAKKEWLAFIGLYPPRAGTPFFTGLEHLLKAPADFRRTAVQVLETFWAREFERTFEILRPRLEQSREEKERLFESCSLEEFARLALLRIEFHERRGILRAVRGGYTLPLKNLANAVIFPSAFNDKRHWTTEGKNPAEVFVYLPYFDPAISLKRIYPAGESEPVQPEADPALIFKALGDTTRYAMVSLIAREPSTSTELAREMELSTPTISHHIHVLREAGLLVEQPQGNTVLLSLNRDLLENLSALTVEKLFYSSEEIEKRKTRHS